MKKALSLFFVISLFIFGCTSAKLEYQKAWEYKLDSPAYALAMSNDGKYIAVGVEGMKGGVILLNEFGKMVWENVVDTSVHSIAVDSVGRYFAVGDEMGRLHLFGRNGNVVWEQKMQNAISLVVISKDGKYIAAGEREGIGNATVHLFSIDGNELWRQEVRARTESLTVNNKGEVIYGGWGSVHLIDKDGKELWSREVKGAVRSLTFSPDDNYLLVGMDAGKVLLVSKSDGKEREIEFPTWSSINAVYMLVNGFNIIAGVEEGFIYMTDMSGQTIWRYDTKSTILTLNMTPDGSQIVAGTVNGLEFTNNKGRRKGEILIEGGVNKTVFSQDGSLLVAISGSRVYLFKK